MYQEESFWSISKILHDTSMRVLKTFYGLEILLNNPGLFHFLNHVNSDSDFAQNIPGWFVMN